MASKMSHKAVKGFTSAVAKASLVLGDKSLTTSITQRFSGDFVAVADLVYGESQML